jgi:hypothetical protein
MNFRLSVGRTRLAAMALCVVFGASGVAQAEEPTPAAIEVAKQIIAVKGVQSIIEPIIPGVAQRAKAVLLQSNPMLQKDLNEVTALIIKEFQARRVEAEMIYAKAYAAQFTEAELKGLLTFYQSPLGKKMVTQEPIALQNGTEQVETWANDKIGPQIFARIREEMKKRGHEL